MQLTSKILAMTQLDFFKSIELHRGLISGRFEHSLHTRVLFCRWNHHFSPAEAVDIVQKSTVHSGMLGEIVAHRQRKAGGVIYCPACCCCPPMFVSRWDMHGCIFRSQSIRQRQTSEPLYRETTSRPHPAISKAYQSKYWEK